MGRISSLLLLLLLLSTGAPTRAGTDGRTIVDLMRSRRPRDRERGLRQLVKIPGDESVRYILASLADPDADVRREARRALSERSSAPDLSAIARFGFSHRDPRVRRGALAALVAAKAPGMEPILKKALADPDPGVREAAAGDTVTILGGRGRDMLAAAVRRGREGRPRAAALVALEGLDAANARELAASSLQDPAYELRVAAIEVLSREPANRAVPLLVGALTDRCWSCRLTAMRGLARLRKPGAVAPLIAALSRERGRLRQVAGRALYRITGVELPAVPKAWTQWWSRERDRFEPPKKGPSGRGLESRSAVTFHHLPVTSESVAFVLDRSRSMRRRVHRDDESSKADLEVKELARTLRALSREDRFFLVAFGTKVSAFAPRPLPAGPVVLTRALKWFQRQRPRGRTNISDALLTALAQPQIDTIYLLTDGAPSAGSHRTRKGILAVVARANRYHKAEIDTIAIGRETAGKRWRGFLAELAKLTGGRHADR